MAISAWSTDELPPGERLDGWAETVRGAFVPLLLERAQPGSCGFQARISTAGIGDVSVSHVEAEPHRVRRTQRLARTDDTSAYYKLCLQLEGTATLRQDDRIVRLQPGQLAIYDTTRPYDLSFNGPYHHQVTLLPIDGLRTHQSAVAKLTATAQDTRTGLNRLLADTLLGLPTRAGELTQTQAQQVGTVALGLVDAALDSWLGCEYDDDALFADTLAFIEHNLRDPSLTPAVVASSQFISLRSLQAMFSRRGLTPSAWIRRRRLEMCHAQLASSTTRSVSEIAADWGFTDSSHFSRAFRNAYGIPPRDARRGVHSATT